ncbi:endonuclease [Streptomyces sp. MI02-7b]|uniref:endonuclease n=1 Tax=Streptomyces sp. MI02-7b TaxID=462941 RepID=UPI0029B7F184|nr:endonuclease [Streptomyces sp. MI02-7b]MDX3074189.1 endonuclease [Streptomyces sp. MI02-7b]
MRDYRRRHEATWQQRVDALGKGHYRRYEPTAARVGKGAQRLLDRYGGDLRRLRDEAGRDPDELRRALRRIPQFGPVGVDICLREVQSVWPEVGPLLDGKAIDGARGLGLPQQPEALAELVPREAHAAFAAALVRAALDRRGVDEVAEARG